MKKNEPPKTELDSDTAERVLQTDLANILSKTKSGKPLSKHERALVATHKNQATSGHYSINKLAGLLGADRRTLAKKLADTPPRRTSGRVKYYSLADAHTALNEDDHDPAMRELRRAKLSEEIAKLKMRNDLENGKLVRRADVCVTIQRIFGGLMPRLEQKLTVEFPSAICVDVVTGRIYGKRLYDQITEAFREFSKEWEQI